MLKYVILMALSRVYRMLLSFYSMKSKIDSNFLRQRCAINGVSFHGTKDAWV